MLCRNGYMGRQALIAMKDRGIYFGTILSFLSVVFLYVLCSVGTGQVAYSWAVVYTST
jgi:hypothetical protein